MTLPFQGCLTQDESSRRPGLALRPPVSNHVVDFYRCPEALLPSFSFEALHPRAGYFRFGPDAVGYGQSSFGPLARSAAERVQDISRLVAAGRSVLRLPFSPSQVVDNLRLERY